MTTLDQARDARARLDAAWLRLGLTCAHRPDVLTGPVRTEISRRSVLFNSELSAVESVHDDLLTGRWQP